MEQTRHLKITVDENVPEEKILQLLENVKPTWDPSKIKTKVSRSLRHLGNMTNIRTKELVSIFRYFKRNIHIARFKNKITSNYVKFFKFTIFFSFSITTIWIEEKTFKPYDTRVLSTFLWIAGLEESQHSNIVYQQYTNEAFIILEWLGNISTGEQFDDLLIEFLYNVKHLLDIIHFRII